MDNVKSNELVEWYRYLELQRDSKSVQELTTIDKILNMLGIKIVGINHE